LPGVSLFPAEKYAVIIMEGTMETIISNGTGISAATVKLN
jgi:hypothetical protein